jgi:hypothetical protein
MTRRDRLIATGALALFVALAAIHTHPVLPRSGVAIASDRYDPVLNASILWWNATTVPFSSRWWTPPHYYPSEGVAAFTENLVGLSPIATPLYWLTGDPLRTYNLVFVLTWPLTAFAAYLLVWRLTRRHDASVIAALAFAFAPYRLTQLAHLQVLACFWFPLALLGLHAYQDDPRPRWLALFGAAWVLQSLTNGYFMLFGAVLITLWLAYFCSPPQARRRAVPIVLAWILASLPLLPVLLTYRAVHEAYGLGRSADVAMLYSADALAWVTASPLLAFWPAFLSDGRPETGLFPGATAAALVLLVCGWVVIRALQEPGPRWSGPARCAALALTAGGTAALIALLVVGPWRIAPLGVSFRMSGFDRALWATLAGAVALFALTPGLRAAWRRRSPLAFYAGSTLLVAVFCLGPVIRAGRHILLAPAPYGWLLILPGFDGLRVPTRFWMLGALCLAVAAGLAFARVAPARGWPRIAAATLLAAGVLVDGWVREMPTDRPPQAWLEVERRNVEHALIELPLGPEYDAAATYRAVGHRRRVVNGVSGYDPPHYLPLQRGLAARDPDVLLALTSFGVLDVVVDGRNDPDGALERYVASSPGAIRLHSHERRTLFRLPATDPAANFDATPLRIAAATASDNPDGAVRAIDDDIRTAWMMEPQRPGQWLMFDLGASREIAAIVQSLGSQVDAYPRYLEIHTSLDGETWHEAWEGPARRPALSAVMRGPLDARMVFTFAARPGRFVRLRAGTFDASPWSVADVRVHGPSQDDASTRR